MLATRSDNSSSARSDRSVRSRDVKPGQLLLIFRNGLLGETLSSVLQSRFSEAGTPVVVSLPTDQTSLRSKSGMRVLLTDRVDPLSLQLIERTIPTDVTVCLGELSRPASTDRRRIVLPAGTDADTVFAELLPLFPAPPVPAKKAKPIGPKLSPRETEVLRQIAVGNSIRDIAEDLSLSPKTVENQKYRMMDKLQIRNTAELTRYAIRIGLVEA